MKQDNKNLNPPKFAKRLLRWFCNPEYVEDIEGDLFEMYEERVELKGENKAKRLYYLDVILLFRPSIIRFLDFNSKELNFFIMFQNYLTIAWRNILKRKGHTAINISGLALGIATSLLVFLFVKNEITFDRFHENADNIYRITNKLNWQGNIHYSTGSSAIAGTTLKDEIPEIKNFFRIKSGGAILKNKKSVSNERFLLVDRAFFQMLSFPFLHGDPSIVMLKPNEIVLSERKAYAIFGMTNVIGEELELQVYGREARFTISGVAENPPTNSSFQFDMVLPFSYYETIASEQRLTQWDDWHLTTFLLTENLKEKQALENKIQVVEQKHKGKKEPGMGIQPFLDIHLDERYGLGNGMSHGSSPFVSYLLSGISLLILLIACINFTNLSIGMALPRAREIGMRKVVGAKKLQLITQFWFETLLITFFSLLIGLILAQLSLPIFSRLTQKSLSIHLLWQWEFLAAAIFLMLVLSMVTGIYPAVAVSRFGLLKSLQGKIKVGKGSLMTKGMVIIQFCLAVIMLFMMQVLMKQMDYVKEKDLGYQTKGLIEIESWQIDVEKSLPLLKNELGKYSAILSIGATENGTNQTSYEDRDTKLKPYHQKIETDYLKTMGVRLVDGRNFDKQSKSDFTDGIIVNEAFVKEAGIENPIGSFVPFHYHSEQDKQIIGVVNDYVFQSLRDPISPLVLHAHPDSRMGLIVVKLAPNKISEGIDILETTWKKVVGNIPFEFSFREEFNERLYEQDKRMREVVSYAAGIALFISCLGLFGLSGIQVGQRKKEMGIRQVLGATSGQLFYQLSKDFILLISIASIVACPFAWYFAEQYLQDFTFRTEIGWFIPSITIVTILLMALFSITYQIINIISKKAVNVLKSE